VALYTALNARVEIFSHNDGNLRLTEDLLAMMYCSVSSSMQRPVRKLLLRLAWWFWARDTDGKRVQAAGLCKFLTLMELGQPVCGMRLNSLSLH